MEGRTTGPFSFYFVGHIKRSGCHAVESTKWDCWLGSQETDSGFSFFVCHTLFFLPCQWLLPAKHLRGLLSMPLASLPGFASLCLCAPNTLRLPMRLATRFYWLCASCEQVFNTCLSESRSPTLEQRQPTFLLCSGTFWGKEYFSRRLGMTSPVAYVTPFMPAALRLLKALLWL